MWKIVQLFFLRDRPGVKQREIPGVAKNTVEILSYAREKATRRTGQLARKHVKENLLVCETCLPKLPQSFTVNIVVLYLSWHCLGLALIKTIQWCMVINNSCRAENLPPKMLKWTWQNSPLPQFLCSTSNHLESYEEYFTAHFVIGHFVWELVRTCITCMNDKNKWKSEKKILSILLEAKNKANRIESW